MCAADAALNHWSRTLKPAVIFGVVVGIVVLAAWVLVPGLKTTEQQSAEQAIEQATLAQRQMKRYAPRLEMLADLMDLQALAEADLRELAAGDADAGGFGAGQLESGISGTAAAIEANREVLAQAIENANQAAAAAADAGQPLPYVYLVQGQLHLMKARTHLLSAQRVRIKMRTAVNRTYTLVTQRRLLQIQGNYYGELDIGRIVDDLQGGADTETGERGLAWLEEQHREAEASRQRLADAVEEREQAISAVRSELNQKQRALNALEEEGFTAGDDEAFKAFREAYTALSNELRDLQVREEALTFGDWQGEEPIRESLRAAGVPVSDPNATGLGGLVSGASDEEWQQFSAWYDEAVESGKLMLGLGALQGKLAAEEDLVARYADAIAEIEERIAELQDTSSAAADDAGAYEQRLEAQDEAIRQQLTQIGTYNNAAYQDESAALDEARRARSAFNQAAQAQQQRATEAATRQREQDPERTNERLKLLTSNPYGDLLGKAAAAHARVFEGRVCLQIADNQQKYMDLLDKVNETMPGFVEADTTLIETALTTARDEGEKTLREAAEAFAAIARGLGATNSAWLAQCSRAVALYELSRLNPSAEVEIDGQSMAAMSAAQRTIFEAVSQGEAFPYMSTMVQFRDFLVPLELQRQLAEPTEPADTAG